MEVKAASLMLEKNLETLWQRGRVALENISNATTPGYKRKVVSFEDDLQMALQSLEGGASLQETIAAVKNIGPEVHTDRLSTINVDGNNVDVDQEYVELLRTTEQYQYAQRLLNDNYARLRYAITEGKG